MKEIDIRSLVKEKTKVEVTQEKEQEYRLVYQGTIIPHENHTLFEIDVNTQKINRPEYTKQDYIFNPFWKKGDRVSSHSKVVIKEGKMYVSALNKKNALEKFKKGVNGTKIDPNKSYLNL